MSKNKRTKADLQELQALPLEVKIKKTQQRIREWVNEFGIDGVYVSFSGGKDSLALLHLARQMYPNMKAAHVNTSLEYPEIEKFVKTFDNVDIIKPKITFVDVIKEYGYPIISKEVSECVYGARRYLTEVLNQNSLSQSVSQSVSQWSLNIRGGIQDLKDCADWVSTRTNIGGGARTSTAKFAESDGTVPIPNRKTLRDWQIWEAVRNCKIGGGGEARRFARLTGICTAQNTTDPRLWGHYRQFADTEIDGDQSDGRQSNDGDYP